METKALQFYAGIFHRNEVKDSIKDHAWKAFPFPENRHVIGWEGGISAFRGLHVGTWLSFGSPRWMGTDGIFGLLWTGDTGAALGHNMGLNLSTGTTLYLTYWAHNNTWFPKDWHTSYVLYLE